MSACFGWQGFSLEHPNDWAPVAISGDRRSGYARLASPRGVSLQIRWAPPTRSEPSESLDAYFRRLAHDARRKRRAFSHDVRSEAGYAKYRYRGETNAEGVLFSAEDGRIVFLEAIGDSSTARAKTIAQAHHSFSTKDERWSVLSLDVRLPTALRVARKEFLAGRTTLELSGRGVCVLIERWGLAESLLARADLLTWASNRLENGWDFEADAPGLRANRKTLMGREEAILLHHKPLNQITLVKVRSRNAAWRPQWDWLG